MVLDETDDNTSVRYVFSDVLNRLKAFSRKISAHQAPRNATGRRTLTTAEDGRIIFLTGEVWCLKIIAPVWPLQPLVASFGLTSLQRAGAG